MHEMTSPQRRRRDAVDRFGVGYTFLYWSQLVRPGDQVDTNVNLFQGQKGSASGVPSPQFNFSTSEFLVQGLNLGFDYHF